MNSDACGLIRVCLISPGPCNFDDRITMPQHSLCLTCNLCCKPPWTFLLTEGIKKHQHCIGKCVIYVVTEMQSEESGVINHNYVFLCSACVWRWCRLCSALTCKPDPTRDMEKSIKPRTDWWMTKVCLKVTISSFLSFYRFFSLLSFSFPPPD